MTKWNLKSKRTASGGIRKRHSKKKKYQRMRDYIPTKVGRPKIRKLRTRGGNEKYLLLSCDFALLSDKEKTKKAKILSVLENPANLQYARRNIITKGAIIETELGKAKVTSRPGQHGVINAVLIRRSE